MDSGSLASKQSGRSHVKFLLVHFAISPTRAAVGEKALTRSEITKGSRTGSFPQHLGPQAMAPLT